MGKKINEDQAAALDKLKVLPFKYKMDITKILQDGIIFDPNVYDISTDTILAKFKNACSLQTSLSLGANFPTKLSAPHSLLNGFMNLT